MNEQIFSIAKPIQEWIWIQKELNHGIRASDDYTNRSMAIGLSCEIANRIGSFIVDGSKDVNTILETKISIERPVYQWVDVMEEVNDLISETPQYNDAMRIIDLSTLIADEIGSLLINE